MAVIDAPQLHRRPRDDLQRVLRAAVAEEVRALDAEQQVQQRRLQRAVLLLEMCKRVVVDEWNQHQAVAVGRPKRPIDVDEAIDGLLGRPRGQLANMPRRQLENRVKYSLQQTVFTGEKSVKSGP